MSLIAQLEAMPGMAHWAVYVALHLPSHSSPDWPHLRDSLVQELLMRHAPEWAADSGKQEFLLQKLKLPAAWLDQSMAQWAHYCRDDSGKLAVSDDKHANASRSVDSSLHAAESMTSITLLMFCCRKLHDDVQFWLLL